MTQFSFALHATDGAARAGLLTTPHGDVETPIFMPVGTVGSVKALGPDDLTRAGARIVLGNTYHLMLRPGPERVERLGGLHSFTSWNGPMLTDSGGFQVFSLGRPGRDGPLARLDDDGVTFKSHLDGQKHRITPEESMRIQMCLGADFIMAFDHCPPGDAARDAVIAATDRTTLWLDRCAQAMSRPESRLLGIVQGGIFPDLREAHARTLAERDLFGYAIGGLSVGESKEDMRIALSAATAHLPKDRPRYLMGVGTPEDILDGIERGVDMFDCVMPTRNARNGTLFTSVGKLSVKIAAYADDTRPVDAACDCYTCTHFSRAYLRHLYQARELLFFRLASLHNVRFYMQLVADARRAIGAGTFVEFAEKKRAAWSGSSAIASPGDQAAVRV